MSVIATLAYMLRVIARRLSGVGLGVDDWLLLSALVGRCIKLQWRSLNRYRYGLGASQLAIISVCFVLKENIRTSTRYVN